MPEVGLAGLPLDFPYSGTAAYARNLIPLLSQASPDLDYRLFLRRAPVPPLGFSTDRLTSPFAAPAGGSGMLARLDKLSWEIGCLPLASLYRRERLLHSLYFAAPIASPCPVVVTVHDLIPLLVPGYYRRRFTLMYPRLMARTVARAAAIITVSEHARQEVLRILRVPESRVYVTPEAADPSMSPTGDAGEADRLRERYPLPERFLLYLGGAERRKNLETLVRAWASVGRDMADRGVRLVIVATFPPPDHLYPDIPGLARELVGNGTITFIPSVAEGDKPALYRAALAFCFPSTHEGFGLTPLEAMACGTPVMSSNATSLPEVVGDAAISIDPMDIPAWSEAMVRLVDSDTERARLREAGCARAATFSWTRTAEQTVSVYRTVLGR